MPLEAKICGLKKKEDIILSINKGASYCGFIVNYPKSHRNIKSKSSLAKLNSINKKNSKFVLSLFLRSKTAKPIVVKEAKAFGFHIIPIYLAEKRCGLMIIPIVTIMKIRYTRCVKNLSL